LEFSDGRHRSIVQFITITSTVERERDELEIGHSCAHHFRGVTGARTKRGGGGRFLQRKNKIAGSYIVMLKSAIQTPVPVVATQLSSEYGGNVGTSFQVAFKAFQITNINDTVARRLSEHPLVEFVEQDHIINAAASPVTSPQLTPELAATVASLWGLNRADQRIGVPSDGLFSFCTTGAGVLIYVVDTGVLPNHEEFTQTGVSRVRRPDINAYLLANGQPSVGPDCWASNPASFGPNPSHGTSVASVAAGNTYGVAKGASIVDVRVLGCGGGAPASRVAKGLEWILVDPERGNSPRVVNMSFEFYNYDPELSPEERANLGLIRTAVNALINNGITTVAAAGNANENAFFYTPAGSGPIGVGAYQKTSSQKWSMSNYGSGIAFYAPGQYVESASIEVTQTGFDKDYSRSQLYDCSAFKNPIRPQDGLKYFDTCTSGTSFAAPYVAGIAARYLQGAPLASQYDVMSALEMESDANHGYTISEEAIPGTLKPIASWIDCQ